MQKHQIAQYAKIMQEIGIAPQPVPKKFDEELYKNEWVSLLLALYAVVIFLSF